MRAKIRAMFRSIVNQSKKPIELRAFTLNFGTKASTQRYRPLKEINEVKLVGTLTSGSYELQPGLKLLTIKTKESSEKSSIHKIYHESITNLPAGLRIYVIGKLRSTNSQLTKENTSTSSFVKADKVFVLDIPNKITSDLTDSDINTVQLIANVISEAATEENDSSLSIVAHHQTLNKNGAQESETHLHRVYAKDQNVHQDIQKTNFNDGDRVLIQGRICQKSTSDSDGQLIMNSCIVADNVFQIENEVKLNFKSY